MLQRHLFPSVTYHYNSGGDPEHIPDLTHADLVAFHRKHYHPSNAVFMTYGNFPVDGHHERFEELALSRFEQLDHGLAVPDEQRYRAPVNIEAEYATDTELDATESHVVMGWLLGHSDDLDYMLRAQLLSSILMEHSGSPLLHALETTELGSSPSELCGLGNDTREATFVAGLEGVDPANALAVETMILDVLRDVAANPVPREAIESCLHQLELNQREVRGDGFPFGLSLMVRTLGSAMHGADPAYLLDMDAAIERLREDSQADGFVASLVRELLLDNPHRVRLTMKPSSALSAHREARERERLAEIRSALTDSDLERINAQADALRAAQDRPDDTDLLPFVTIADVPTEIKIPRPEPDAGAPGAAAVNRYSASTNGLVYAQIAVPLPALSPEHERHLAMLGDLLTEVGSGARGYQENQAWQMAHTGGIGAGLMARCQRDDPELGAQIFALRGKALARNTDTLIELLADTLAAPRFDEPARLRELVAQMRAHEEARVTDIGHSLAMSAAANGLSPVATLNESRNGLTALKALKALDADLKDDAAVDALASQLTALAERLAQSPRQFLAIAESAHLEHMTRAFNDVGTNLPAPTPGAPAPMPGSDQANRDVAWLVNSQVNFCARAFRAVPVAHPDAPALMVAALMMRNDFLHREVREKGGAYGGGATYDPNAGLFGLFSYRDPRLIETLDSFTASVDWAVEEAGNQRAREAAILGVIGALDRPGSPAGEASAAFYNEQFGRDPDFKRNFRAAVLEVDANRLRGAVEQHLTAASARTAVVTSKRVLEQSGAADHFLSETL
ncbi:MAG: insulinase family protein [Pseudomonadota bacterium]